MALANRDRMFASLRARLLVLVCASVALSTATTAQQTGNARGPEFDVASIKPNKSGGQQSASAVRPGGLYVATNVTLRMLIQSALNVRDQQIVGGGGQTGSPSIGST
jgi:hypothetical protein